MGDHSAAAKLPIPGKRNVLITSALPYVNNVPHLGNIIGCVLSADVFARYCRMRGYNTLYICGTDEYGTATETKALEEGCSPKEICDKYHAIHKEVYKWFNISFDEFGRTSSPQQTEVCQSIFKKLWDNNWLVENTMQQLYCDTCNRFLADRLVEGNCPTPGCNYDSARGDQCEKCGKLLNPTELLDPKCKVCRNTPRIRDTDHLFLELPLLKDKLEEYVSSMSVAGGWSQNAIQATYAWLREGLKQRCITRDLKWGVPVPHDKYKDKVFYVWFDAPIGYVSITSCHTPEWEKWWKNPEDVELYQFMGKDNVPFHTVIFPSTLLGTGENWTMMKTISVTEYLNYETGKFSKSKGVGVFGNDAKDTNIPVEVWRYYLLTNRPEVSDTLFTWSDLQAKLNSELLSNLGNFVNRVLSFIAKDPASGYGSVIPDAPGADSHPLTKALGDKVGIYVEQYIEAMEKVKLKQGLKIAMSISGEGNAYLQESQFWKLYKEDRPSCSVVMKTSTGLVYLLACLLEPFMPSFTLEVLKQLNFPLEAQISFSDEKGDVERAKRPWEFIPAHHRIGTPSPLFRELKDEEVEFYREKFAGSQADRLVKAEAEAKKITEKLTEAKISDGKTSKKDKTKKPAASKPKVSAPTDAEISISRLDIRVGLITKAQKHPDADSLYVEEIDVGEPQPRTVVSGLVKYIPLEEMQNRKVCVLCNLKPAAMRGIKSQAMVLAASNSDHTKVELVEPPQGAAVGERVTFPGIEGLPDDVLNPKKKVWETLQVDLHSDKDLVACYKDLPLTTSAGVCKVSSIAEGSIR
ncbi:probable methionine--tRNA ligase [Salvia splendens]|uniref:probable methionine--tRNA ligase n=1 Tax=Salvia splendens TaxID=180675 RepID=UPI001C26BBD8|nr:probable methionine--tRNA ligase [Salvia splendens]